MSNITTITPIVQGMKGSVVAQVLNANSQNMLNLIQTLKAEIEELKKTALIGNNGTSGASENAVVNIMYDPQTIMAKTSDTDEYYTVNVKVMCGNKEVYAGDVDDINNNTFKVTWDNVINVGGLNCTIERMGGKSLSFRVKVSRNSIADGSFNFHITFRGITYDCKVNVISTNKDSGFEYAQGIFVSTIFKRFTPTKEEPTITKPVGGTYSIPLPSGDDHQGWSDGIPSGTKPLYTCHRKFTSNGQKPQENEWSTPILAMDSADLDVCFTNYNGVPGEPNGPKGSNQDEYEQEFGWHNVGQEDDIWMATCIKKGNEWGDWSIVKVKGENGTSSAWKNTIYKRSDEMPAKPTSVTTDFIDKSDAEAPNDGWHDVPDDNGVWWMSSAYIDGDTGRIEDVKTGWSIPVKVSGGAGQGVFISTVFKRSLTQPTRPSSSDGGYNEPVPESTGWYDSIPPSEGATKGYPVWESHRRFTSDGMNQEATWSEPKLMMDTADFDCCFCEYYEGVPGNPVDNQGEDDGSIYHWHEAQYGSSNDNWMATRYKSANSSQWSSWVITKIKGESGNDGNYTNYIFKDFRGDTLDAPNIMNPENFVDKEDGEIVDDEGVVNIEECNQGWKDGPGVGDTWWMSCAVIDGTTNKVVNGDGWSTPTKLTGEKGADGSYTEYRYAINDSEVDPPIDTPMSEWSESVSGALHTISEEHRHTVPPILPVDAEDYKSVPSLHYMWMGMRRHYIPVGGSAMVEGKWEYARVTGEKGEGGTKLKINGSKDSYRDLFLLSVDEYNQPRQNLPNDGDSYVVNKEMWVWSESSSWVSGNSTTQEAYETDLDPAKWQNCGGIVGPSGTSQYLHIKYAKLLDKEVTVDGHVKRYPSGSVKNTPEDCDYMGTLVNSDKEAPDGAEYWSGYTWSRFTGEDGYGYEYVYKLSSGSTPYNVPLSADCKDYWYKETSSGIINSYTVSPPDTSYKKKTFQDNDYIPSGWTDNPSGITEVYPFEFMCKRVRQNGKWGEFTGQANNNTKAILYTYKGKDGEYEQRQWAVFDALVETDEMHDDTHWGDTAPKADQYKGHYLWERVRRVKPQTGGEPKLDTWYYIRISGEKGDEGTSLNVKGTYDTLEELFLLAYNNGVYDDSNLNSGDAYTVSGHMWTWNESNDKITTSPSDYGTTTPQTHWRDAGEIVGPAGQSQYIHIKYADVASACTENGQIVYKVLNDDWLTSWLSPNDGELPGNFIGICIDSSDIDPDVNTGATTQNYKWSKYQGEDGIDYEMIYTRTKEVYSDNQEQKGPSAPIINDDDCFSGTVKMSVANPLSGFTEEGLPKGIEQRLFQDSDFIPYSGTVDSNSEPITTHNWTDNPMGVTEEYPYEWACRRDKIKGLWTNFYGRADNTEYAFLYNKWGKSNLDININCGQNLVFRRGDGDKCAIQTQVIEFTLAKDNLVQTPDRIIVANYVEKKASNGTITEVFMSNFFNMPTVKPQGDDDCHSPYVSLTTKEFTLESGYTYSFDLTLVKDNVNYVKKFTFTLEAKNGDDGPAGKPNVKYEIKADKQTLKFNAIGKLDMDDNDGISVSCFIYSGDTTTHIDWGTDENDYSIWYQIDSLNESVMSLDQASRPGGNAKNVFLPKSNINMVTDKVTIKMKSGNTLNSPVIQTITIPVIYESGSNDNLFSKDNTLGLFKAYCSSEDKLYSHAIHTNTGFNAVLTFNSSGYNVRTCGINIEDNPYDPHYVTGEPYVMTGKMQIKNLSGSTTYNGNHIYISGFTCANGEDSTLSKRQTFAYIDIYGNNWSSWYDFEWRTTGYTACPQICLYRQTGTSVKNTIAMKVKDLKVERLQRDTDSATPFMGLGNTTSLAMSKNNLFEKSGSFASPFLVYYSNDKHDGIYVNPSSNVRSGITTTAIPYGYCGNTVLEVCDSGTTANCNRWGSFLIYLTKIAKGQYYTISWYQRSTESHPEKQPVRLNISNPSNLVPEIFTICGSGQQSDSDFKVKTSQNRTLGMSFPMTNEWTRHYLTFYYMPSGSTSEMAELNLDWYYLNADDYINHKIQFTMPKLETGDFPTAWQQHESDRIGKPLRGPSEWKEGEVYEGGGANDNYQDLVTYNNSSNMYLCKVTHTAQSSNSPSHSATYGWTESTPWQVTEKRDFIAADVIWSDKLKAEVMSAVNAKIDELLVKKLETSSSDNATVKISDGTIKVYGSDKVNPNIVFGVDDYGNATLSYYQGGNLLYDLGPSQITSRVSENTPRFSAETKPRVFFVTTPSSSLLKSYISNSEGPIYFRNDNTWGSGENQYNFTMYQFHDGFKAVSNVVKFYYYSVNGSPALIETNNQHSNYDGLMYTDNTLDKAYIEGSGNLITNVITITVQELTSTNKRMIQNRLPQKYTGTLYINGTRAAEWDMYMHNATTVSTIPVNESDLTTNWYWYGENNGSFVRINPSQCTIQKYVHDYIGDYNYYDETLVGHSKWSGL